MRVIALYGRGNIGKTRCLGHLINLIYRETEGCNCLFEGKDKRITLDFLGKRISICTWGDNGYEEQLNLDWIRKDKPDIAILATRTKGETVKMVERFCENNHYQLKWVEKYVASFDELSGQEYLNNLQAEQLLDYVHGLIMGQLYYVDSISSVDEEDTRYHVILLGTKMQDDGFPRTLSLEINGNQLHYMDSETPVREDDFVYFRLGSGHQFLYANDSREVIELRRDSRSIREELAKSEIHDDDAQSLKKKRPDRVKSYHVKVGHGNCNLILAVYGTNYELWMVDCSTYDYLNRQDYSQDLYHCLKDIAGELNIDLMNLRISRFMLTHTHFDHYNGLRYLIKLGFINNSTLVYANLHYDCASTVWKAIMESLKNISCKFVEPVYINQTKGLINIYHPECRIYKGSSSDENSRVVPEVNNSSVVYGIVFGGRTMVFPGDLERKGFEEMSGHKPCRGNLSRTDYYVVSHHGSLNGHPTKPCKSLCSKNSLECISERIKRTVLMGRNGAYSGIYSPVVEGYWKGKPGGLVYTEKTDHYVELDWEDGKITPR